MTVSEMSGVIDLQTVASSIRENCQKEGKTPSIDALNLDAIPTAGRYQDIVDTLRESDEDLSVVLQQYESAGDFTVIYTAGAQTEENAAADHKTYEPAFKDDSTHQELKRQIGSVARQQKERDTRPLFQKYQFFTPGEYLADCHKDLKTRKSIYAN